MKDPQATARAARDEYAELERRALVGVAERVLADPQADVELVDCATAKLASPGLTATAMRDQLGALGVTRLRALRAIIRPDHEPDLTAAIIKAVEGSTGYRAPK